MNTISRLLCLSVALFFGQHTVLCTNTHEQSDTFDAFYEFDIAPMCESEDRLAICDAAINRGLNRIKRYSPQISVVIPATKKVGSVSLRDNTLQTLLQAQHISVFLKGYKEALKGCAGSIARNYDRIAEDIRAVRDRLDNFFGFEPGELDNMFDSLTPTQKKALKKASVGTYLLSYALGVASCDKHSFSYQTSQDLSNILKKALKDAGEPDNSFNQHFAWLNKFSWNQSPETLVRELHKHAFATYTTFNGT